MMTTLERHGWALDDAERRHAESPATFHIPSRIERDGLAVGQMVQLLFLFLNTDPDGSKVIDCEKMWVTILRAESRRYWGRLESIPRTSVLVAPLDEIEFCPEHVGSVFIRKTDPRHPDYREDVSYGHGAQ